MNNFYMGHHPNLGDMSSKHENISTIVSQIVNIFTTLSRNNGNNIILKWYENGTCHQPKIPSTSCMKNLLTKYYCCVTELMNESQCLKTLCDNEIEPTTGGKCKVNEKDSQQSHHTSFFLKFWRTSVIFVPMFQISTKF